MQILIASGNNHKVDEIRAIATEMGSNVRFIGLHDLDYIPPEPDEDGDTFAQNAVLKAKYYTYHTGITSLADDSGIVVDALNGKPGVRSARYSKASGSRQEIDLANNKKLLDRLKDVPVEQRTARFICAMALCRAGCKDIISETTGQFEGRILLPEECDDPNSPEKGKGANGFGYDPLFWVPDKACTSAELSAEDKNSRSHRGNAMRQMINAIKTLQKDGIFSSC